MGVDTDAAAFTLLHSRDRPQFSDQQAIADTVDLKRAWAIDTSYYGDLAEANAYFSMRLHRKS